MADIVRSVPHDEAILAESITTAIDALADRLTGQEGYFRAGGTYAGAEELAALREKEARERGDIPWEP